MTNLLQDVRYALRQLRKNPGFTVTAILTLALGIGANVAIFSIVNGIILRPLPVPHSQQIMVLAAQQQGAPLGVYFLSYSELTDLRKQADTFSDLLAYNVTLAGMSADNQADHFVASYVTGNYFSGLGVKPALGRLFLPREDEKAGSEALVVLGYSYWQKRFAGGRDVIGKHVLVDGKPATIIGVAEKKFQGTTFAVDMDGYLSFSMAAAADSDMLTNRANRQWAVIGRLKPGVSIAQGQSSVNVVATRLAMQYPDTDKGLAINVISEPLSHPVPLPNNVVAIVAGLFLFLASVILLLACVNVANILLVRSTAREGEMAIRSALGASRPRLVGQVLTESIVVAMCGAVGGVALGAWSSRWISNLPLASIVPTSLNLGLDWRVLTYALAAALGTGIVVGVWPALRVVRANLSDAMREGGRGGSGGVRRHRVRSALVTAQMAGSLMLLIVAGLFVRSLRNAQHMYIGFEPNHLLNVVLDPQEIGYDQARTNTFYKELEDRVRALPGVQSAALSYSIPLGNYNTTDTITVEGHPTPAGQQPPTIMDNPVDPAYFETMKIPLLGGRNFTDADNESSAHVAIINQTMMDRFWPNEDPIGKRFNAKGSFWQVVGIAQNGKYATLAESPQPYFYLPLAQSFNSMRALEIRTSLPPDSLILPVQETIKSLDPGLPVFSLRTMTDSLQGANGFLVFRMGALLASCIGVMGLTLAVVGVYGVVAFAATQRTREIGIRIALGASREQIVKLVLRQGIWVVSVGAALGLLATWSIGHAIANLLVGVSATDPMTFLLATCFLLAVAVYACYVPARRATRVDPMVALRYE
jgi:putative ABC transport system permease protein